MAPQVRYQVDKLRELFERQRIASMGELKRELGTEVDVTVFRKLRELGYHSSYSHNGRYYTLAEIAEFDELGLWSYASVGFSKHGTLRQTLKVLVETSAAGYFASELRELVRVEVKHALLELVERRQLIREKVDSRWLYSSAAASQSAKQLAARKLSPKAAAPLKPVAQEVLADEVRAAIVIFYSLLDEKQRRLYAGLEALKWGHGGDRKIAQLLGLDEKTVARGRKELLSGDIERDRVRREGAGRPPVKKGRQK